MFCIKWHKIVINLKIWTFDVKSGVFKSVFQLCNVVYLVQRLRRKLSYLLIYQSSTESLNSPDLNPVDCSVWETLQPLICGSLQKICGMLISCWELINQELIDKPDCGELRSGLFELREAERASFRLTLATSYSVADIT